MVQGTRWCSWLKHCATSRKVAGSFLDVIIEIFYWPLDISWGEKAAGV